MLMDRLAVSLLLLVLVLPACAATEIRNPPKEAEVRLTPGPTASKELIAEIEASDRALFAAVFDTCDVEKLADLLVEDFEFYHDKWGLAATSREQFVDAIRGQCERQREGTDFRARRELVAGSMKVYPLNNYGAIEVGAHRFYALHQGGPDQLTETALFTQVWKNDGGKWRLARVLSYGHVLARETKP